MNSENINENPQVISRKDRERERHKNDILEAAERVFVRDGVMTKIESIAHEAEYAVGSIYNFFPSKDDLFKNVLLRISQMRDEETRCLLSEIAADPWGGLPIVTRYWIKHHIEHGDFLHIAFSRKYSRAEKLFPENDEIAKSIKAHGESYRGQMLEYFNSLSNCESFRRLEPDVAFYTFEGYLRTSMFHAMRKSGGKPDWKAFESKAIQDLIHLFSK